MVSGRQVRAARALLAWSREDLAARAGTSVKSVARAEGESEMAEGLAMNALIQTLENSGIVFVNQVAEAGVTLRSTVD